MNYLTASRHPDNVLGIMVFSTGQLIDEDLSECGFTSQFGRLDGSVAMDCDDSFHGWKVGLTSAIAVELAEPYNLVDGVIVY